ncbi:MAG: ribonuclease P protein component [Gemmatimonadota bacterium]|nr:MAG: ribonuclease P protein component [Gemmatimonadota bacterium]
MRKRSELRDLYRRGKRRRTDHLDVFVAESPALRVRLAVVVPKHGRKIVERNRLKRRLRESARLELLPRCLDRGVALDILIRARSHAYEAEFQRLRGEIRELAEVLCSQSFS